MALNAHLPPAVRIARAQTMPTGFHARFSAIGKTYEYRIWNDRIMCPLETNRAWHHPKPIDPATLRTATTLLIGTHDFAAFAANRGHVETDTVRTIHTIRIVKKGPLISLHFSGNGFLYRMVRLLSGALARTASLTEPLAWLEGFLRNPSNAKCQYCAPAEGLYLRNVRY
jgi:tRNA pseudouridine38-40 synthase